MNPHMFNSLRLAENVRSFEVTESGFCLTACFGSACLVQLELNTRTNAIDESSHAKDRPMLS